MVLAAVPTLIAQAPNQPATHEKIIHYVRARFAIPDSVKITMTDLRESIYADFLETTIMLDDGKDKRSQPLFVSKNYALFGGRQHLQSWRRPPPGYYPADLTPGPSYAGPLQRPGDAG